MEVLCEGGLAMQLKGFLIVLSGPSGAGKNTLMNAVFPSIPQLNYSVSVTTRPPREGEQEGVDYFFVSNEEFDQMLVNDELLEHADFCGNRYGTPRSFVEQQIAVGKTVIMDIDIQGAAQIRQKMPDAVFIFLMPPTWEELKQRLKLRGKDPEDAICQRLEKSFEELKHIIHYDYYIINDELDKAADRLRTIINAEWCRVQRVNLEELQELWRRS